MKPGKMKLITYLYNLKYMYIFWLPMWFFLGSEPELDTPNTKWKAVMPVMLAHLEAITTVNHRVNPYLMSFPAQFF